MTEETPQPQRRNAFRVDLLQHVQLRMRNSEPSTVDLTDLSGTGCSFVMRAPLELGAAGALTLALDDGALPLDIEVRSCREDDRRFIVGVEFVDISTPDSDRIVKAVFARQRLQLKRLRTGDDGSI